MPKPLTFDRLRSQKKPNIRKFTLPLDYDIAAEYERLEGEFQMYQLRGDLQIADGPAKEALLKDLESKRDARDKAKAAFEAASHTFVFQSIGRKRYNDMKDEKRFRPTPKQIEEAKEKGLRLDFNADTFPQALIAVSCVSVTMTEEQVLEMWDDPAWSEGELLGMFDAAYNANTEFRTVNLGKG
jgi:hypothetical protein